MKWLKHNLAVILTAATLLSAGAMAFGRLQESQRSLSLSVQGKIDRDQVLRELDQVHNELANIDAKLDGLIIRRGIVAEE